MMLDHKSSGISSLRQLDFIATDNNVVKVHLNPKYFFQVNKSLHLFEMHCAKSSHYLSHDRASEGHGSIPGLMSQTDLHRIKSL